MPNPNPPWLDSLVNLSGALPDEDGNVNIDGGNCYRVQADPGGSRVVITNDCKVCCTCDDYAGYAKTITLLLERLAKVWKGPFFPDPDYANLHKLAETINDHITEYNSVVFPKIRTAAAWGHVMVGARQPTTGKPKASAHNYATIDFVVVNRVSEPTVITGVATFNRSLQQAGDTDKDEGKAQTGTITVAGSTVNWTVTLAPFTEEHLYVLVRSPQVLTGLAGSLTYSWTQYGIAKTATVPVT